jgi:phage shock protein E
MKSCRRAMRITWLSIGAFFLAACIAVAGVGDQKGEESLAQVQQNIAAKRAILIDVRERKEWDRGHLQDAQLVPLSEINRAAADAAVQEGLSKKLPSDRVIYCHCAKGVRAVMAGGVLKKLGYDVRPLKAGYDELRDAGFPVAKPGPDP